MGSVRPAPGILPARRPSRGWSSPFPDIVARPRRRHRLVPTTLTALAALVGAALWWLAAPFLPAALSQTSTTTPAVGIHKVQAASWRPDLGQPLFIAVLGSDTRNGPPDGGRGRCDAIHIVAINPQAKAGTILNFARDAWVDVPGRGRDKLNAACVRGPQTMVQALKNLTGIPIQYYAITEFSHFMRLVDELGGIEIDVPYAMRDSASGANFRPGPQHLLGGDVLAFSRNRKDTPRGDFSRSENQGLVILAALRKFRSEAAADHHRILDYVRVARRHTEITVPVGEFIKLSLLALEIDPANVQNVTIPGSTGSAGGASVVFLSPGDIFDRVRDDGLM